MREYETTIIIQPEISDEGVQAICARLDGILDKHGSVRLLYDDAGRRRLAYEIQKFQKGRYVTLIYLDEGKVVTELERILRLDDSVLRFLTVQANDDVKDIGARKAEAAELERVRAQKAAERAAREAEEAARAAAEAEARGSEAGEGAGDDERPTVARSRGDDDNDDDERPSSRSRDDDDDDDDERPSPRSRSRDDDDD